MDTSFKPQDPVPGWDGNARGWRRYSREVAWYGLGTKKKQRAFLAPRLISKLSGPARLLAMSWNQRDFKGNQGAQVLLQRLAASPLVRKNLPNTSAIMNQYFTYKRFQQESIANYLVRESLYYEEFVESLMALKDEQDGVVSRILAEFSESEESDHDEEEGEESEDRPRAHQRVPRRDPDPTATPPPTRTRSSASVPSETQSATGDPTSVLPVSTPLSAADSCILKQLRGWRLLFGACLSAEEWRSVLAATNNKLDYENVSVALSILYDDQINAHRQHHPHGGHSGVIHALEEDDWLLGR